MRHLTIPLVLVFSAAAAIAACDDGSDADGDSGSDATGGGGDSCLQGAWSCMLPDGSTAEMTISGDQIDGSFIIGGASATVIATLTVDGNMVSVVDTGGQAACAADLVGQYTYTCSDTALNFTVVSDDCMGRLSFFGCDWTSG